MRILLISKWIAGAFPGDFGYYGEWRDTFEFAKALSSEGIEVELVTPKPSPDNFNRFKEEFGNVLEEYNIKHHFANTLVSVGKYGGSFRLKMFIKELEILRKKSPDIIQYMQFGPSLLYLLRQKVPIAFYGCYFPYTYPKKEEDTKAKSEDWNRQKANIKICIENLTFKLLNKVFGATNIHDISRKGDANVLMHKSGYDLLRKELPHNDKIFYIPKGVDLEEILKWKQRGNISPKKVFYMGTIYNLKGIFDLLKAFKLVNKSIPDAKLMIAGTGPISMVNKMLSRIKEYDINAEYLRGISNYEKFEIFNGSTIFCLPSYHETFSSVIIEAMAFGLPVITTKKIDTRVEDGITGIRVSAGDHIALANAIIELLANEEKRKIMGKEAEKVAEMYSWNKIAKEFKELYVSLLYASNSGRRDEE